MKNKSYIFLICLLVSTVALGQTYFYPRCDPTYFKNRDDKLENLTLLPGNCKSDPNSDAGWLRKTVFWEVKWPRSLKSAVTEVIGYGREVGRGSQISDHVPCWPLFDTPPVTGDRTWYQKIHHRQMGYTSSRNCICETESTKDVPAVNQPSNDDCPPCEAKSGPSDPKACSDWKWDTKLCQWTCPNSPIILDIAGNGFDFTSPTNGVFFDLNNDGIKEKFSWTPLQTDDAWLFLDRNGNGAVDSGAELFGNFTPQPAPPKGEEKNGFLALAEYDKPAQGGNGNRRIDSRDQIFLSLHLWQDKNHNGISEPSEIHLMAALGVLSIDLDYQTSKRTDQHGNQFKYKAQIRDAAGLHVGSYAWDVFLVRAP